MRNAKHAGQCIILLHAKAGAAGAKLSAVGAWSLVSLVPASAAIPLFSSPPENLYVFDSASDSGNTAFEPHAYRPWIKTAHDRVLTQDADIHFVSAFSGAAPILSLTYGPFYIALITQALMPPDSVKESLCKEDFDIAVCIGLSDAHVRRMRALLRPRCIIALPCRTSNKKPHEDTSNILRPSCRPYAFDFSKDSRKRLRRE